MPALRFPWSATAAAVLAVTLSIGMADARGGGHGGFTHASPAMPTIAPMHPARPMPPPKGGGGSTTSAASVPSSVGFATVAPPTMPPSAIGTPMERVPDIAPLSPQLPEQFATGGTTNGTLALSPGAASGSPSESAPSAPGGGGKTLHDCMGFWDRATHMTKAEWKAACLRTMEEFPDVMR